MSNHHGWYKNHMITITERKKPKKRNLQEVIAETGTSIFLAYLTKLPLAAAQSQFVASQACPAVIYELLTNGGI